MNYQEYTAILKRQTSSYHYQPQLQFAILICKKLFFDYQKFTEIEKWGDADLVMDAINICQKALGGPVDIDEIKALIPEIDSITPDMDDFGRESGSYALNAATAVYETLEFIVDRDTSHIYNIGDYYTDTIDFKIQEDKELTEIEIANHPLMIEAWNFIIEQTKFDS